MMKKQGNTYCFDDPPRVLSYASVVGKKEGEGPLSRDFDYISNDNTFGEQTWEKAESRMMSMAFERVLNKGQLPPEQLGCVLGGDLLNQCISTTFALRPTNVPFFGLYGACSTMAESLCLGSMLLDGEHASTVVCAASSHFCTAERQYRYPLEFGSQRPPTAQWTVTGAGAVLLTLQPPVPPQARVTRVCMGRVVDLGVNDANNMGAAMAPAAADTLLALLADTHTQPADYDLIVTGDLGQVGRDLLLQLMREQRMPLDERLHRDCGLMIYDRERQDAHAGGSGCGCSASVLCASLLPALQQGDLKRIIFMATGALMSVTSSQQGETIPGIAHAVVLESPKL